MEGQLQGWTENSFLMEGDDYFGDVLDYFSDSSDPAIDQPLPDGQGALSSSKVPAAVSVGDLRFNGPAITTKPSRLSVVTKPEAEDPSSARSAASAVHLDAAFGQHTYGAFNNCVVEGLLPAQAEVFSSSHLVSPFAVRNSSAADYISLESLSSAQLQNEAGLPVQELPLGMQTHSDPCRPQSAPANLFANSYPAFLPGSLLSTYQTPAAAGLWRGPVMSAYGMVLPAEALPPVWAPSMALSQQSLGQQSAPTGNQELQRSPMSSKSPPEGSQELQRTPGSDSKKRVNSDDPDEDADWNPYAESQAKPQARRRRLFLAAAPAPSSKPKARAASRPTQSARRPHGSATSTYRGVGKHKYSGKWEAHLWDSNADREPTEKCKRTKGKQFFLGSYHTEAEAARAYDRASLVFFGMQGHTNFPASDYARELPDLLAADKDAVVKHLRTNWHAHEGFEPTFPGVFPHQALAGMFEARLATSNKTYQYLGAYPTEAAAHQALEAHRAAELQAAAAATAGAAVPEDLQDTETE